MSNIINTSHITPGCIYRIYLENFVTYKEVELYPSTSLNLIIGPNGTGKSTFVCAIILGLCGKTSLIGRTTKISDYIRTGCKEATIEIELYQENGQRNVIIKRKINSQDVTKWRIDNKEVDEKKVQQLIEKLNIQVDNLCQLLPQDRVQDFSKLNSKELLKSTLLAVKGEESVKNLNQLIDNSLGQKDLKKEQSQIVTQLNILRRDTEQLRLKVENIKARRKERNEFEEEIKICEKMELWLKIKDLKNKIKEQESVSKTANASLKDCQDQMKPLIQSKENNIMRIREMEKQKESTFKEIENLKNQINNLLETIQSNEYMISDAQSSYKEKVDRQNNREKELNEANAKLEMLINNKKTLEQTMGDETDLQKDQKELQNLIDKTTRVIDLTKQKKINIEFTLLKTIDQMSLYKNRLDTLQNVDNERLNTLKRYNMGAYNAVMWLRKNRKLFKEPVHEPMMLVINFTEPRFARYLEATVPQRDLLAFTFECKDDMNEFLRRVRAAGLRGVGAVSCARAAPPAPAAPPPALARLGFSRYLAQALSAPPAVLRYLCATYALDRIPLGDRHTYEHAERVPATITCFFTENHKFTVRTSAYSREVSTSTFELSRPRLFANTLDVEQIDGLKAEMSRLEKSKGEAEHEVIEIQKKLSTLQTQEKELNEKKQNIVNNIREIRNKSASIRLQEGIKHKIANEQTINTDDEKLLCKEKQKEAVLNQCRLHQQLLEMLDKLHQNMLKKEIISIKLEKTRTIINEYKSKIRLSSIELEKHQEIVDNTDENIRRLTSSAQELITKLKHSCNNKLPIERAFPYSEQFRLLPSDLVQLQKHRSELETRMNAINPGDAQVFKDYEIKEKEIAELKKRENISNNNIIKMQQSIDQLKGQWLTDVNELIHNVNDSFRNMFKKVDCAGEVKLEKGESEDDFSAYGIGIWVKFREKEEMMQLSRHTQSGGERTLTTALYLLALQRLATVPFRCVDEINQGMDSVNERKMLQLLVKETTGIRPSQYFLLTPKLLPNLEYNERIMIHTIMNGKTIMNYREWNYQDILQNARSCRSAYK